MNKIPVITTDPNVGFSRRRDGYVPLLDDPPMGHFQALVLKKLDLLGDDAYGQQVLEDLSFETRVWIDYSQIYSTIRRLVGKGYIVLKGKRAVNKSGPQVKIYELTAEGRAALSTAAAHHRAVVDYLEDEQREETLGKKTAEEAAGVRERNTAV